MNIKCNIVIVAILISLYSKTGFSARILGFFPSPSRSHLIVHLSVAKALLERGHNVSIVTTIPLGEPNPGFNHIELKGPEVSRDFIKELSGTKQSGLTYFFNFLKIIRMVLHMTDRTLEDPKVKQLQNEESFDLVLLGYFFNDFHVGLAAHFQCPVAIIWMIQPMGIINDMVGNPPEISYVPSVFLEAKQPMDFFTRIKNFLLSCIEIIIKIIVQYIMGTYYEYHFPREKYPSFNEATKNISLVLVNNHFTQGPIRPNVPALIEIGGIQINDKPNPLANDIKQHLQSASKDGAIYFSLGSNLHSAELKPEVIKVIYNVLSKLPQKIIWKWEKNTVPGNSSNILFGKWFSQNDILAHPNIKLFITHGGKGSVMEANYFGVPMIGLPVFGDQMSNVKNLEESGFGIRLDLLTLTEDALEATIHTILQNKKYAEAIKKFSTLYRDRPQTAKETATFWLEYVIRHRGALHMQSPYVHMNIFQALGLDVFLFIVFVVYIFYKILRCVLKLFILIIYKLKTFAKQKID